MTFGAGATLVEASTMTKMGTRKQASRHAKPRPPEAWAYKAQVAAARREALAHIQAVREERGEIVTETGMARVFSLECHVSYALGSPEVDNAEWRIYHAFADALRACTFVVGVEKEPPELWADETLIPNVSGDGEGESGWHLRPELWGLWHRGPRSFRDGVRWCLANPPAAGRPGNTLGRAGHMVASLGQGFPMTWWGEERSPTDRELALISILAGIHAPWREGTDLIKEETVRIRGIRRQQARRASRET